VKKLPHLLITELVVDSEKNEETNLDLFNFIEIYNNTDRPIHVNDIHIRLRSPSRPHSDKVCRPIADTDVRIPPGKPMVFWLTNEANDTKSVNEFNSKYGCNLTENETIVRLAAKGVKKIGAKLRAMVVATHSDYEIAVAQFNANSYDVYMEKSMIYRYPEDSGNLMVLTRTKEAPTPGKVEPDQIPAALIPLEDIPVIRNLTSTTELTPIENLEIIASIDNDVLVKQFELFFKNDSQDPYTKINVKAGEDGKLFRYTVEPYHFFGSRSFSYYFVATDGGEETRSEIYDVNIQREAKEMRLNRKDQDVISGIAFIKAAANDGNSTIAPDSIRMLIDGVEQDGVIRCLDNQAYFAFEAIGVDKTCKNSVMLGDDLFEINDYWRDGFAPNTVIVPVDPDQLLRNEYTLTIHSGSRVRALETRPHAEGDEFAVRNVRLYLATGSIVRPVQSADPIEEVHVGGWNEEGQQAAASFTFEIPSEQLTAGAWEWDTSALPDGEHRITVAADGIEEISATVAVDNSGPVITTNIEEGKEYRGNLMIQATAADEGAGVDEITATLNQTAITVPYTISSNELGAGTHQLCITARDRLGNQTEVNCSFRVALPKAPSLLYPEEGELTEANPSLQAMVEDPGDTELKVTFFQGYNYTAANKDHVKVYRNATDVEPPDVEIPAGESRLTEKELAVISSTDDQAVTIDSEQFPYMRFEVLLNEPYENNAVIELFWKGRTVPGRRVTMYAWNHSEKRWAPLNSHVAQDEGVFALTGKVGVSDYVSGSVKEHRLNVLVQDLVQADPTYDFTIVLVPDTQMYSMSDPSTFDEQMNWIVRNAESMNIPYVVHVGDLVDLGGVDYQWVNADRSMRILDEAGMPHGVLPGNHDVNFVDLDFTNYWKYFGAHRFEGRKYYGESFKNNTGHYDLISVCGIDFVFVYMGWTDNWNMQDDEVEWVNRVLAEHRNRHAILVVHDYMNGRGERFAKADDIYEKVVLPNPHIQMVLSGHSHGSALLVDKVDDDGDGIPERTVNQMCGTKGVKSGYMTLLHFDKANNKVYCKAYSPTLNHYNGNFEWTLDMDLVPQVKRVATQYFAAKIYAERSIRTELNCSNGSTVSAGWEGLEPGQQYCWYVRTEDSQGGVSISELRKFTVKE
jgi:DNA repair exonuclease SbcCD nuclease subunit